MSDFNSKPPFNWTFWLALAGLFVAMTIMANAHAANPCKEPTIESVLSSNKKHIVLTDVYKDAFISAGTKNIGPPPFDISKVTSIVISKDLTAAIPTYYAVFVDEDGCHYGRNITAYHGTTGIGKVIRDLYEVNY